MGDGPLKRIKWGYKEGAFNQCMIEGNTYA